MTRARVDLNGELTIVTAAETLERLKPYLSGGAAIELSLAGVTDIDTAGLQLLLLARREADRLGTAISFSQPSPVVHDLLELTRLGDQLDQR